MNEKTTLIAQVPVALKRDLSALAAMNQRSMSGELRLALIEHVAAQSKTKN